MSPDEDFVIAEREMLVLLYEFPAETWLTVYRRLDNIGAVVKPVPRAPRLFITLTSLNNFLVYKHIMIWNSVTWKVFFMY